MSQIETDLEVRQNSKSSRFGRRFGTFALLVFILTVTPVLVFTVDLDAVISFVKHDVFRYPTFAQQEQQLYEGFAELNPNSLAGWEVQTPGPNHMYYKWFRENLVYYDSNYDGRPDMKALEKYLSTTEFWWEDTDFDGKFETVVSRGCSGWRYAKLLKQPIAVPNP